MGTGYRPPSREPKGRWARHIHAVRKRDGWSQTAGFEAVQKAGLGLSEKSRSAYIAIDMGDRQPTPDEERVLLSVYGPPPEVEEPAPVTDQAALIAVLTRVAEAMEAQTRVLAEQKGALDGYADGVQGLLVRLVSEHVNTADEPSRLRAARR